jgi:hypothetical protein
MSDMTTERELRQAAREIAAQAQAAVTRLEQETLDLKTRLAEKEAERDAARLAPKRLANYPVRLGTDYQCPRCWIEHEKRSPLRPIPSGDKNDILRCGICGEDFIIAYFR